LRVWFLLIGGFRRCGLSTNETISALGNGVAVDVGPSRREHRSLGRSVASRCLSRARFALASRSRPVEAKAQGVSAVGVCFLLVTSCQAKKVPVRGAEAAIAFMHRAGDSIPSYPPTKLLSQW